MAHDQREASNFIFGTFLEVRSSGVSTGLVDSCVLNALKSTCNGMYSHCFPMDFLKRHTKVTVEMEPRTLH